MEEMEKSWEEKLKEGEARKLEEQRMKLEEEKKMLLTVAHLINLNEDLQLTRKV